MMRYQSHYSIKVGFVGGAIWLCATAGVMASVLFEDDFVTGGGNWAAVCRTDASVSFNLAKHRANLTVAPANGQPVSMWHSFTSTTLSDGDWIEVKADVRLHSSNTTAAPYDIRIALADDNGLPLSGTTANLAIPYSGYYVTASSHSSGSAGRIVNVDGAATSKNFFNSSDGRIDCQSANTTVEDQYLTVTLRLTRSGTNLLFSASLYGEWYGGYTIDDTTSGTMQDQFSFNAVGIAYAYSTGQVLFVDDVTVSTGSSTVAVDDYYETGDGTDWGPAIRRAVADAQEHSAQSSSHYAQVIFSSNTTYQLEERADIDPQIPLYEAERLSLIGNGATLVSYINNNHFSLWRCRDVTISGFKLDLDPLPFTQGEVIGINRAGGKFDLEIDSGFAHPPVTTYTSGGGADDAPFFDSTGLHTYDWFNVDRVTHPAALPTNVFRVFTIADDIDVLDNVSIGDQCVIKTLMDYPITNLGARRVISPDGEWMSSGAGNIEMRKCDSILIQDVESYAARQQTVHTFGCGNMVYDNFQYYPKPNSGCLLASNKGGLIMRSTLDTVLVTNCYFESAADDLVNASDHPFESVTVISNNVIEIEDDRYPMEQSAGWNLLVIDPDTPALKATCQIDSVEKLDGTLFELTLDQITFETGYSALSSNDWIYVERKGGVYVLDSILVNSMKKGIISRGPTLVSGCLFEDLHYGIHHYYEGGASNGEGPHAYGLQAVNNTFADCKTGCVVLYSAGNAAFNVDQQNIVSGNTIDQSADGEGIKGTRMNGVTIENNDFTFDASVPSDRDAIDLTTCADTTVSGNTGDRL